MFDNSQFFSGGATGFYPFTINNSLRFNDDDTAFLSRTLADSGDDDYTLSVWIKRSNIGIDLAHIYGAIGNSGNDYELMRFNSDDQINWQVRDSGTLRGNVTTDAVFRDVGAWYNIVFYRSGTTAKIYVNGVEQTLTTATAYQANYYFANKNTYENRFGVRTDGTGGKFDGYMAEINFIDGSALAPASFGETKNDIWVSKNISGLTYGANGFRLQFKNSATGTASSSTIGADTGGNNLHFTSSGIATTDQVLDSPTNNHATLNSIQGLHGTTLSDGNLKVVVPDNKSVGSTIAPTSGKWYAEVTVNSANYVSVGVCQDGEVFGTNLNGSNEAYMYSFAGIVYKKSSSDSNPATFGATDKIGIFLDLDNNKLYFKKNNTGITTSEGQHSVGSTGISIDSGHGYYFAVTSNGNNADCTFNFGQNSFTYSPDGGHKALNTDNLPNPGIDPNEDETPDQYFDTTLYAGNSTTQPITGLQFQPDFVWLKVRNEDLAHGLFDSIRGTSSAGSTNTAIASNRVDAQGNNNGVLSAFTSDGFTLDSGLGSNPNTLTNNTGDTYVAWTWKSTGTTQTATYVVKVVDDGGNKYRFDDFGTSAITLELSEGGTYTFDQSDSSNGSHPLRFSTTSDGTHGGGSEYTTGVTTSGTPGTAGAFTRITVATGAPTLYYYCTQHSGMGGQANTPSTKGYSNFKGTIQSKVLASTESGFSIVKWTGNNTTNATVGHGLSASLKPRLIMIKPLANNGYNNWQVQLASEVTGEERYLRLNRDDSSYTLASYMTNVGDELLTFPGTTAATRQYNNSNNIDFIAYCFADVEGYLKIGTYEGNNVNGDNSFVYTGFRPAWIMIKNIDASGSWGIWDTKRNIHNTSSTVLYADQSVEENTSTNTTNDIDIFSNGFKVRGSAGFTGDAVTYLYMAIAEQPFKYSNAR